MAANKKDPVLVVLQMSGAYDALNTFIPYSDPLYVDNRPVLRVEPEDVLAVDDKVGFNPAMALSRNSMTKARSLSCRVSATPSLYALTSAQWNLAHCRAERVVTDGWLGRTIRELDPNKENVLTGVNFGRGLPRAMAAPACPLPPSAISRPTGFSLASMARISALKPSTYSRACIPHDRQRTG